MKKAPPARNFLEDQSNWYWHAIKSHPDELTGGITFYSKWKFIEKQCCWKNWKNQPGPLAPPLRSRPSLNITALSYSWTTCNDDCMTLIYIYCLHQHLETNTETEGKSEDNDDPGDGSEQPAAEADPSVNVLACQSQRFDLDKTSFGRHRCNQGGIGHRKKLTNVLNYQVPHL